MSPSQQDRPGPRAEKGVMSARILAAARTCFAVNGLAATTVRQIAIAADVDPALVYHYFGSKQALLDACTTPTPQWAERIAETWAAPRERLGELLVRNLIENWNDPESAEVTRAVLLIAAHDATTREKLKMTIQQSLLNPALPERDHSERLTRASLVASQLMGLAMVRYVWQIEPLASLSDEQIVAEIAPTIQSYIDRPLEVPNH
jgi:AcrR family transcriptional regulator